MLSGNLVSAYAAPEPAATASRKPASSAGAKKQKAEDPKVYKQAAATEKQLIHVSEDGLHTFFLENVDLNNGRGALVYYQNDSPKSRTAVASSVYYKVVVSKDGKSVLYLQNTDDSGFHGELFYWNAAQKEPVAVEQDVCADNFVFAQNGLSALYIKNYNPILNTSDLCVQDKDKNAAPESREIDEKTAIEFSTTQKNKI